MSAPESGTTTEQYLEGRFTSSQSIYAEVLTIDENTAIIADRSGHLTSFDLRTMQTTSCRYVGHEGGTACTQLQSLRSFLDDRRVVVATQGGYAVWWDIQGKHIYRLFPALDGPVNSACFLFDDTVILGLGWFPLSGKGAQAAIEVWQVKPDGSSTRHASVSLPGCCVEQIAVSPDLKEIACWTGNRRQNTGHLVRLDVMREKALSHDEFSAPFCGSLSYLRSEENLTLVACTRHSAIRVRIENEQRICEELPFESEVYNFALNWRSTHALFNNGVILDVSGDAMAQVGFQELPVDCTSVAIPLSGGCVALSRNGTIRYVPRPSPPFVPSQRASGNGDEKVVTVSANLEIERFFSPDSCALSAKPAIVVLCGGPATGKTTIRKQHYSSGYVVVDAAEVFLNLCQGRHLPFPGSLEQEQAIEMIGEQVALRAIRERRNIVTEMIPADEQALQALIDSMTAVGYQVKTVLITCDLEVAQERNLNRTPDCISAYYAERFQRSWLIAAAQVCALRSAP